MKSLSSTHNKFHSLCVSVAPAWIKMQKTKFLITLLLFICCTTNTCTSSFSLPSSTTITNVMSYNTKLIHKRTGPRTHTHALPQDPRGVLLPTIDRSKLTLFNSKYDNSISTGADRKKDDTSSSTHNLYSLGLKPTPSKPASFLSLEARPINNSNNLVEGNDKESSNHDHERTWNLIDTKSLLQEQELMQEKDKLLQKKKNMNSSSTSSNDNKQEMKSLLNITMPNPSDYHQHNKIPVNATSSSSSKSKFKFKSQKQQNNEHLQSMQSIQSTSKPNHNNLSSYASSFMDSYVNATTTNINFNTAPPLLNYMTKTQPSPQSSSSSLIMNNNIPNPNTPLTLSDLQRILNENGYVKRDELSNFTSLSSSQNKYNKTSSSLSKTTPSTTTSTTSSTTKSKKIAFPQPSTISNKHIRIGTSISSSFFTILIVISLQPNLWMIGSVIGAIVGNDIATKNERRLELLKDDESGVNDNNVVPGGLYGDISLNLGTRIARIYLLIWDFVQGVWFMVRLNFVLVVCHCAKKKGFCINVSMYYSKCSE